LKIEKAIKISRKNNFRGSSFQFVCSNQTPFKPNPVSPIHIYVWFAAQVMIYSKTVSTIIGLYVYA
jgi:hypothetical protein